MSELSPLQGASFYDKEPLSKKVQAFSFDPPERLQEFSPTKNPSSPSHKEMLSAFIEGDGHMNTGPINVDKAKNEIEISLKDGKIKGTDAALALLLGAPLMKFLQGEPQ